MPSFQAMSKGFVPPHANVPVTAAFPEIVRLPPVISPVVVMLVAPEIVPAKRALPPIKLVPTHLNLHVPPELAKLPPCKLPAPSIHHGAVALPAVKKPMLVDPASLPTPDTTPILEK